MKLKKKISDLPPNSAIVAVKRNLSAKTKFYPVFSINGYLSKCKKQGKIAYYAGKTNNKGELEL